MADFTITQGQQGAYEIPVAAGATVVIAAVGFYDSLPLTVLVHSGTAPVYARPGATITAKDPLSTMIFPAGTWATTVTYNGSIAVTSSSDAVVSVYR